MENSDTKNPLTLLCTGALLFALSTATNAQTGWIRLNCGTNANLLSMYFSDSFHGMIMGDSSTLLFTSDGGATWDVPCGDSCPKFEWNSNTNACFVNHVVMLSDVDAYLYGGCAYAGSAHSASTGSAILMTSNAGASWQWKLRQNDEPFWNVVFKGSSGLASGGYYRTIGDYDYFGNSLLHSSDGGVLWSPIYQPRLNGSYMDNFELLDSLNAIGLSNRNLWRSTNGGASWNVDSLSLPGTSSRALFVWTPHLVTVIREQTDSLKGNNVYVARSMDWATSWNVIPAPDVWPAWSTSFPDPNNGAILSDSGKVFFTQDGGEHWNRTQINSPFRLSQIIRLDSFTTVVIGDSGTIYRTTTGGATAVTDPFRAPRLFSLDQNYPNPFGGDADHSTTINYSLAVKGHVSLKIFNALGVEVASLVNAPQAAGNHAAIFRANNLEEGLYWYRLSVNGMAQSHCMAVVLD